MPVLMKVLHFVGCLPSRQWSLHRRNLCSYARICWRTMGPCWTLGTSSDLRRERRGHQQPSPKAYSRQILDSFLNGWLIGHYFGRLIGSTLGYLLSTWRAPCTLQSSTLLFHYPGSSLANSFHCQPHCYETPPHTWTFRTATLASISGGCHYQQNPFQSTGKVDQSGA